MSAPVFHIGFAKAASSYLQAALEDHDEVHYPNRADAVQLFCAPEIAYDQAAARAYIKRQMQCDGRLVLSHERLVGNPHSGFYDWAVIARRIADTCPNAKIIIVIREQFAAIASSYKQYVLIGGTRTFLEYVQPVHDFRLPHFDWRVLRYIEVISLYKELFGDVLVIPVEMLQKGGMEIFWSFIGVEPHSYNSVRMNVGMPDEDVDTVRRKNIGLKHTTSLHDLKYIRPLLLARFIQLEPNAARPFTEQARELLGGAFSESNDTLSSLVGVDLGRLGYQCSHVSTRQTL